MAKKGKGKGRGGARKGAGRPLDNPDEGRTILVAVTVPADLVEQLDGLVKREGGNRSKTVTDAIRMLLDAKSRR